MVFPIFYILLVLLVLVLLALRLYHWLGRLEQTRRTTLEERKRFESIKTKTPFDNPGDIARERGLQNISLRFTVLKRAFIPAALFLLFLIFLLPTLSSASATYVSFVIGSLTLIVGIAARPFIENLIAGIVISLGRRIQIGDTVRIDEYYGTVERLALSYAVIKLWDWRRYIVPNTKLLDKELLNYSIGDRFQWAYVEFWVSSDSDMELVRQLATSSMEKSKHFRPYEPASFWVINLERGATLCWVAGWADTPSEAWDLRNDARTTLLTKLQEHNIKTHLHVIETYDKADSPKEKQA